MTRRARVTRSGHPVVALLTRLPVAGRAKTRLIPALGPRGAARLHRAMAELTAAEVCALAATGEARVEVWHDRGSARRMRAWLGRLPHYRRQPDGDLGQRLAAVFARAVRRGADRCLVVGSDCPALTAGHLRQALARLQHSDVVLGPAADGGYWLIGIAARAAQRALPGLFADIPWSTAAVLGQTCARARELGLGFELLERLSDVDRVADLEQWRQQRPRPTGSARLSVIIPALEEEAAVAAAVASARRAGAEQVIVADGGSGDRTRQRAAAAGAAVVAAPRGRARQMNAGAALATGDMLLFLHADTRLPPRAAELVRRALAADGVVGGAFAYAAAGAGAWDPLLTLGNRLRLGLFGHPYGDQGLFLRARIFRALGGFPDLPVMEDWELVARLRRLGRVVVLPEAALTSAASFAEHGLLRACLLNLATIVGHQLGVDTRHLAALRARVARRPDASPRLAANSAIVKGGMSVERPRGLDGQIDHGLVSASPGLHAAQNPHSVVSTGAKSPRNGEPP